MKRGFLLAAIFVASVSAQDAPTLQTGSLLDKEYTLDPGAADLKYRWQPIQITGLVMRVSKQDAGMGHLRIVQIQGERESGALFEGVQLCFTESCSSIKQPTVNDETFLRVVRGAVIVASCTVEQPYVWSVPGQPIRFMPRLSGCLINQLYPPG